MRVRSGLGALIVLALFAGLAAPLFAHVPRQAPSLTSTPTASRAPWPLWAHGETRAIAANNDRPAQPAAAMSSSRTTERQGADLGAVAPEDEMRPGAPATSALLFADISTPLTSLTLPVPTPPPRLVA